eukprot:6265349-Amphidinium_carterae.4
MSLLLELGNALTQEGDAEVNESSKGAAISPKPRSDVTPSCDGHAADGVSVHQLLEPMQILPGCSQQRFETHSHSKCER